MTATNPFNLTDNEIKVAKLLVRLCLEGMGGKHPLDLEHDEYTWADPKDLVSYGYSKHEAAGYFSSLASKGFLMDSGDSTDIHGYPMVHWYVVTSGWKWVATIWEESDWDN